MKKIQLLAAIFLCLIVVSDRQSISQSKPIPTNYRMAKMGEAKFGDWLSRWEHAITTTRPQRYCDSEKGEEIGWLMMPFLRGFYYGYLATGDHRWVEFLVRCTDSWISRAVTEPDGYLGWPKVGAAGTEVDKLDNFNADSMLGEAMALRYVVLMSLEVLKTPALGEKYRAKAESYVELAEQVFEKWDKRGAWRDTVGGGAITVILPFGIDEKTSQWTGGYENRNAPGNGFSHPNNKANYVASWLLAMFDATGKAVYRERAEKWFRLMKSRMKPKRNGTYAIWNYWQPAGEWDYRTLLGAKHWVGVHPNAHYYDIDVDGIVTAYEHGLVFTKDDINHLIDTALAEKRYWPALVPYSNEIQGRFEAELKPDNWHGLAAAPWYLALQAKL